MPSKVPNNPIWEFDFKIPLNKLKQQQHSPWIGTGHETLNFEIVKIYQPKPSNQDLATTDSFKYYLILKDNKLGEGGFGTVYEALELDATTGKVKRKPGKDQIQLPPEPLVYKESEQEDKGALSTHSWLDRLYNEMWHQPRQEPKATPTIFYNKEGKTYAGTISEFIPGAGLRKSSSLKQAKRPLAERLTSLLELSLSLEKLHTRLIPSIHRDLKINNIAELPPKREPNKTSRKGAQIFDWGIAKRLTNTTKQHTATTLYHSTGGTDAYKSPEALVLNQACTNSDVFTFTLFFIIFLRGDAKIATKLRHEGAKKLANLPQNLSDLDKHNIKSLAETPFAVSETFLELSFPENLVCTAASLKELCKGIIIPNMQHVDYQTRYCSSEIVRIIKSFRNLILIAEKDATAENQAAQYVQLAQLLLASKRLWQVANFDTFDFAAHPAFCKAVYVLHQASALNAANLAALFTITLSASAHEESATPNAMRCNAIVSSSESAQDINLVVEHFNTDSSALITLNLTGEPLTKFVAASEPRNLLAIYGYLTEFAGLKPSNYEVILEAVTAAVAQAVPLLASQIALEIHPLGNKAAKEELTQLAGVIATCDIATISYLSQFNNNTVAYLLLQPSQGEVFLASLTDDRRSQLIDIGNYLEVHRAKLTAFFSEEAFEKVLKIVKNARFDYYEYLDKQLTSKIATLTTNHFELSLQSYTTAQINHFINTSDAVAQQASYLWLLSEQQRDSYLSSPQQQSTLANMLQYLASHQAYLQAVFTPKAYQLATNRLMIALIATTCSHFTTIEATTLLQVLKALTTKELAYLHQHLNDPATPIAALYLLLLTKRQAVTFLARLPASDKQALLSYWNTHARQLQATFGETTSNDIFDVLVTPKERQALAAQYQTTLNLSQESANQLLAAQSPQALAYMTQSNYPVIDYLLLGDFPTEQAIKNYIEQHKTVFETVEAWRYCRQFPDNLLGQQVRLAQIRSHIKEGVNTNSKALATQIQAKCQQACGGNMQAILAPGLLTENSATAIGFLRATLGKSDSDFSIAYLFMCQEKHQRKYLVNMLRHQPYNIPALVTYLAANKDLLSTTFGNQPLAQVTQLVKDYLVQYSWPLVHKMANKLIGITALDITAIANQLTVAQTKCLVNQFDATILFLMPKEKILPYLERLKAQHQATLLATSLEVSAHAELLTVAFGEERYQAIKQQVINFILSDITGYIQAKTALDNDSGYEKGWGFTNGAKKQAAQSLAAAFANPAQARHTFFSQDNAAQRQALSKGRLQTKAAPLMEALTKFTKK